MTKLSVNINKVATLRNARGGNVPDVERFAVDCELFGAQGITVHPRPDERHIRKEDVYQLKSMVSTELNVEGNPTEESSMRCAPALTVWSYIPARTQRCLSRTRKRQSRNIVRRRRRRTSWDWA